MSSEDKELEEQLVEIGNRLVQLPSEPGELLLLLDQVENFLSRVEQSPPKSTHDILSPLEKALVAEELLRHTDIDVRVAVAACISEVMRITAPNAPYDDTQLKDIYPLFVSSFENLSDQSSRSYSKRVLVLETLAKVKSCVVMLDLDCPGLIVEMFQHFLKSIRDYHPENVFSFMETIMTFLLEESEDIPQELLTPILAIVKKDNEEVLPIARRLGERVLGNSAVKLQPYLTQAMRSLGVSLDDYSEVVASVCEGTLGTAECNGGNAIGERLADDSHFSKASSAETLQPDESKLITAPSDEAAQEVLSSPNSTTKSAKHESQVEETPMTNPKRKRSSGKDQASETLEYGENLVGSKVKVWWPRDRTFYKGVVHAFDSAKKKHLVLYDDGDQEILNLRKQQWELVEGDSAADGLQATEDPSPDTTSELYKRKKTKTHSEPSAEQERMDVSPKRGGAADSNKSKGTSAKSGHKSRDDGKVDGKSKDNTSKASAKSEDDVAGKSKDRSKKSSGKSFVDAPRVVSKSKDVDGGTPKTSTKEDSLQTFVKCRSKISESGSKSSANGMGKVKSSSSKGKETEGVTTSPESTKAKSKDISRLLESETQRFGKKRQRELKHED